MRKRWGNRNFIHHQTCLHHFLGLPSSRQKAPKKKNQYLRAMGIVQSVECLPKILTALSSIPALHREGTVEPTWSPSTQEMEQEDQQLKVIFECVQGLIYVTSCFKQMNKTTHNSMFELELWIGLISYLFIKTYLYVCTWYSKSVIQVTIWLIFIKYLDSFLY